MADTRILTFRETWLPGESLFVGGDFDATTTGSLRTVAGLVLPLGVVSDGAPQQDAGWVRFAGDASRYYDVYELHLVDSRGPMAPVLLNQARLTHVDSYDVFSGGNLRIMGVNLVLPGAVPTARLVNTETGASVSLGVTYVNGECVIGHVGTGISPTSQYRLYYSNGRGPEVQLKKLLTGIVDYGDPYGISLMWVRGNPSSNKSYNINTSPAITSRPVGDGVANDGPAIQAAINAVFAAGGGTLFVPRPANSFKFLGIKGKYSGIEARSNVVVVFEAGTQITYGHAGDENPGVFLYVPNGTDYFGLVNLSARNVDNGWVLTSGHGIGQELVDTSSRIFLKNAELTLGQGFALSFTGVTKLALLTSKIDQQVTPANYQSGPVQLTRCREIVTDTPTVSFVNQGFTKTFCEDFTLLGGSIQRNPNFAYPAEVVNHVLAISFCRNGYTEGTDFSMAAVRPGFELQDVGEESGEYIVLEQADENPDQEVGTVTSATSNTLTNSGANWGAINPRYQGWTGYAIVAGKGLGQWRACVSRTATTATLESDWLVIPDSTSQYSVVALVADDITFRGHVAQDNERGLTAYFSALRNLRLHDLTLKNNGSLDFTPVQYAPNGVTKDIRMHWNISIRRCQVSQPNDVMGCFIGVHGVQRIQADLFGVLALNFTVSDCQVTAPQSKPTKLAQVDTLLPSGLSAFVQFQPDQYTYQPNPAIPAVLGASFENCGVANCDNPLNFNQGARGVYVQNVLTTTSGGANLNAYTPGTIAIGALQELVHEEGDGLVLAAETLVSTDPPAIPTAPAGFAFNPDTRQLEHTLIAGETASLFEYADIPT